MAAPINFSLMVYFIVVAIIGTLGNGVILFAYGHRWSSSKSTSVIFILILACVDLWTCLIVVPTIAIMEYRDFAVPTTICRFYSFSKNLIIISSIIMSFIALDRFLSIALPHCRLLNPRRVKSLLILIIAIGIGLGTVTALAFSTQPSANNYLTNVSVTSSNGSSIIMYNKEVAFRIDHNISLSNTTDLIIEQLEISDGANVTIFDLEYRSTLKQCFADTSIMPEAIREILKSSSNKAFYTLVGIVTIFYTITFVLALRRQNPRIRALKKSLHVLNKFDSYPSPKSSNQRPADSVVSIRPSSCPPTVITTTLPKQTITQSHINTNEQHYEMSGFSQQDDSDDQNLSSPTILRKTEQIKNNTENNISISEGTSDELQPASEKLNSIKQVSFQIENRRNTLKKEQNQHLSVSSTLLNGELDINNDMYYKLPCPCSTTRQLLIKFHFIRPVITCSKWFCCCHRCIKNPSSTNHLTSSVGQPEDESGTTLTSNVPNSPTSTSTTNSDTLRRQLHRHRIQQLRMASTFLIITVSFVLFYLPSILNAERIIKSPIMVYYLYLCTHALNPVIYCFMNPSLRTYVLSIVRCPSRKRSGSHIGGGGHSFFER
ncbi:unnamed protein product [Adineta steineri]|uniref:G-protein coupled receptors family 1 profile domain-containing protein n=1 Tax=Adineta steineri TaxID=433720 RepID=A0A818P8Q5_9BILA|nr:unnamed protein product [Adineta steineri]